MTLVPGQLGNLSTYGIFGPSASIKGTNQAGHTEGDIQAAHSLGSLRIAGDTSALNGEHNLPLHNTMPHYSRYQPPRVDESPFSSDAEIHPSGGVPLYGSDDTVSSSTQHQTHTFEQLASDQGIREWNNGVFDNRWLLQPEEMWKTDARRKSVLTVSPDRQPFNRNNSRAVVPATQLPEASRGSAAQQERIDTLNRQLEQLRHKLRGGSMSSEAGVAHNDVETNYATPKAYGSFADVRAHHNE